MSRKLTQKEFIDKMHQIHPNIEVLSTYINNATKVKCKCLKCGNVWDVIPRNLLRSIKPSGCPICFRKKKANMQRINPSQFVNRMNIVNPNIEIIDTYIDYNTKLLCKCKICQNTFYKDPSHLLRGQGCPYCSKQSTINARRGNKGKFVNSARKVHGDNYSKVNYINSRTKVCIICPKHGEFWQKPNNHLQGQNCPRCKNSKGEDKVSQVLDSLKITYIKQYQINTIFKNHKIIVDFYFQYNGIKYIIEYNGIQHYMPIERFGGAVQFNYQKARDEYLRHFCMINYINLIEIPYTIKISDIEEIINTNLKINK